MIRAAAKNYRHTAVVTEVNQYAQIIADLDANAGCLSEDRRFELAKAAFAHTAQYDAAISIYLTDNASPLIRGVRGVDKAADSKTDASPLIRGVNKNASPLIRGVRGVDKAADSKTDAFADNLTLHFKKERTLRYGENPHQRAAFYKTETDPGACAAWANQLSGQPLSYNNILDLEAALEIVKDFAQPACAIIKHNKSLWTRDR